MTTPTNKDGAMGWPEIRRRYLKTMADLELRLTSGNSVPVERTHLTATEFALMGEYEDACEDLTMQQATTIAALQSRIAELERDAARLGPSDRQAKWELAASLLVELGEPGLASSARGHAIIERMVEEKRRG